MLCFVLEFFSFCYFMGQLRDAGEGYREKVAIKIKPVGLGRVTLFNFVS